MKTFAAIAIISLALTACGGKQGLGGLGAPGPSEKAAGPGSASTFNLADFPNVMGKVYGMWSLATAVNDGQGGTRGVRMFFAKNKIGISVECLSGGHDVISSLSAPATIIDDGTIKIPSAARHDTVSEDGQFTCTASLIPGQMHAKVTGNAMTLMDTGGKANTLTRLMFF